MSHIRKIILFILILLPCCKCHATETSLLNKSFTEWSNPYTNSVRRENIFTYELIGTFNATAYCGCAQCCGRAGGNTASGTMPQSNHTIAADTSVLPFGTEVYINGNKYIVEDTGGAIKSNRIDIFFGSHSDALAYGRRNEKLYKKGHKVIVLKEITFDDYLKLTDRLINNNFGTKVKNEKGDIDWYDPSGETIVCSRGKKYYFNEEKYENNSTGNAIKKIYVLNGSGRSGKDSMCNFVADEYEDDNFMVVNISSVDQIKQCAKLLGWNPTSKTELDRKFLSDLKDLATNYNDSPFNYEKKRIEDFLKSAKQGIMFIHIREPEEIRKLVEQYPQIETILVTNPKAVEITGNHADKFVNEYQYDHYLSNDGTLDDWKNTCIEFVRMSLSK